MSFSHSRSRASSQKTSNSHRGGVPSWFRLRAAFVHLYTASGAVLALLISVATSRGKVTRALWLMFLTLLVDFTDGILAHRLRVSEVLPFPDVVLLDDFSLQGGSMGHERTLLIAGVRDNA